MTVVQGRDLRLVPAAVLTWVVCWVVVGLDPRGAAGTGAALLAGAGAVALLARRWQAGRAGTERVAVTLVLALGVGGLACGVTAVQAAVRETGALGRLAAAAVHVELEGRVVGDPMPVGRWGEQHRVRVTVRSVEGPGVAGPTAADVLVTGAGDRWRALEHGSHLRVRGTVARAPRADDVLGTVRAVGDPEVLGAPGPGAALVGRLRGGLRDVTAPLPPDQRGLVAGAAVGATEEIPDDLRQAMRDAGLTHVTAVSGGHFAVVAVTVLAVCGSLRAPPAVRATVLALAAFAFVQLVHGGASVARAAAAAAVWSLALLLRRPARAVPALAAGVLVLLLVDPWLARSYGFVLSVAATAAIVLLAPALVARCPAALPRPVATVVAVPLAAQLVCAPVLVLLDPVLTTYAVPANVLAAPALLPATLLGLLTTLLSPVAPGPAEAVARLAAVPAAWVGAVAGTAAGLPGARLPWIGGVPGAVALAAATAVGLGLLLRRVPRRG
nr:ComEC/Rec2 family competence protein [uncultured Actinotalea sp.]